MRAISFESIRHPHGGIPPEGMLMWECDRLVKELLLLQTHQADGICSCATSREMCARRHLLSIETLANETLPLEDSEERRGRLAALTTEAREHRAKEERALLGYDVSEDLVDWASDWRMELEGGIAEYEANLGYDVHEATSLVSRLLIHWGHAQVAPIAESPPACQDH